MRVILLSEIKMERANASAFGAFNKAVQMTNKVIKNGNTGGETRAQRLAYLKVSAKERAKKSRDSFDNYNNTKYGR